MFSSNIFLKKQGELISSDSQRNHTIKIENLKDRSGDPKEWYTEFKGKSEVIKEKEEDRSRNVFTGM